jgi:predicted phosphodiesterase
MGILMALAVRSDRGPRLRTTLSIAVGTTATTTMMLVVGLPPATSQSSPEYYAHGPEVPAALRALESLGASSKTLDEEIDEQLVGVSRLVIAPADRPTLGSALPQMTVASDLHNNIVALPALENAARGGLLMFPGDLTDRGAPIEQGLAQRVADAGTRLVFVSGNHDSDSLERRLAAVGAVVLTRGGRLTSRGVASGRAVTKVAGLRMAGYDDPLKRLARDHYRDNGSRYTPRQQQGFADWMARLRGRVDVVMVHAPALARIALQALRRHPPARPLLLLEGHTHRASIVRFGPVTMLNAGSVGGGGTGNLGDARGDIGIARVTYTARPEFRPRAADLVQIDPGDGNAQARRVRLDDG